MIKTLATKASFGVCDKKCCNLRKFNFSLTYLADYSLLASLLILMKFPFV